MKLIEFTDLDGDTAFVNPKYIVAIEKLSKELDKKVNGNYRVATVNNRTFFVNEQNFNIIWNTIVTIKD